MRLFILLLGALILTLVWTNPSTADFERHIRKEVLQTQNNPNLEHVFVRSRSYLVFSYHEFYASYKREGQIVGNVGYAGFGLFKNFILASSPMVEGKKSPATWWEG